MTESEREGTSGLKLDNSVCPRCRSLKISEVARSPVAGKWNMRSCGICWYAWRSTEPAEARDPELYPAVFRLDTDDFAAAPRST